MSESVDVVGHAPSSGEDDLALLERVRAGDDGAYDELYRRHVSAVRGFALSLRRPPIDADDVVGEVFLRVLRAIRAGHGPREYVRTYFFTVARRVVHEWSVARRDEPMGAEQLIDRIPQQSDHQGALVELELLARAFDRLPQRWREVLWRTEVEGYRPATLADQFGLTPNATAVLALRARRGLRRAYLRAAGGRSGEAASIQAGAPDVASTDAVSSGAVSNGAGLNEMGANEVPASGVVPKQAGPSEVEGQAVATGEPMIENGAGREFHSPG